MDRAGRIVLVVAFLAVSLGEARAGLWERLTGAPAQVQLTQEKVDGVIAVQREMLTKTQHLQPGGGILAQAKEGLAIGRQMRSLEKAHGFSDPVEFQAVLASVQNVENGIDPATKTYGGPAYLKKAIEALKTQAEVPKETKDSLISFYQEHLKAMEAAGPPPPGNIELVVKNYDKLNQSLLGGSQ